MQSALGQGSVFTLELPLVRAPAAEGAAETVASTSVIVVVDDEVSAVDATTAALSPLKCTVTGLRDPRGVIDALRAAQPVLIVLDVMMPWVSGLEVLKLLKADPKLSGVPVLVSSAYPENLEAVQALGARFVTKPWRPGELLRVARELIDQAAAGAKPSA